MYFQYLNRISYELEDGTRTVMPDLTKGFQLGDIDEDQYFFTYEIKDKETPEYIANKIYGNPEFAWLILLANDILDVNTEWPLDYISLDKYVGRKYGVTKKNDIHHYISREGVVVNYDWPEYDRIPVTNYEHEVFENDKKRNIRILSSSLLSQVIKNLDEIKESGDE